MLLLNISNIKRDKPLYDQKTYNISITMNRQIDNKTLLEKFAEDFVSIIEKYCKYIVVSGFVAILHGRSRGTEDIDMIIEKLDEKTFFKLHQDLIKRKFYCVQSDSPNEVYTYLKDNLSVRYVKKGTFVPEMEIKFAKDSLDEYQLKTRKKLPLTGLQLYFSSIEVNIAFKEELLKSTKDIEDARHLREIYKNQINEEEINNIKEQIRKIRLA